VGSGSTSAKPKSVHLKLMPSQFLILVDAATNLYEISIYFDDSGGVVLGANAMSGRNTIFDSENNRVGFVTAKCRYVYVQVSSFRLLWSI
jgi:hypothetical protein